jgi:hypothetical protein
MTQRAMLVVLPLLILVLALWGCGSDSDDVTRPPTADKTCLGCHASEAALKETLGLAKVVRPIPNKDDG